ncbi:hypothetical protein DQ384_30010 [Sphaerisporangium album]|uniref:Carrier domain-containing protein n=1 Tax=Sphaerisporangium album TaxID=509200 RepID=A0A367F763_9ACTN|nr:condensation domain-containing protein [Sphaerisporangium album]RCG26208.1 hypothetical protein DQ384_30010 [Sphaerisporangium album]
MTTETHRAVPLSHAQRRLWTLAQLRPGDPFFNIPFTVDVDGPLDMPSLRRAVEEVVRRHPALRTTIRRVGDVPVHVTGDAPDLGGFELVDLADLPRGSRAARAGALVHAFAQAPFDLERGPLIRTRLLRLDERTHRLAVNVHHIVFDGLSLGIFTRELATLYGAFAQGLPSPLPEPGADYLAHAARRASPDSPGTGAELRYWTRRLAGAPETIELPASRPRPAATRHAGALRSRLIPKEVVEPLRPLARRSRATMFMVLKAAFDVLLAHYGTRDVLTGVALSGRDSGESAGLIGYLAKPVVLRSDLSGDPAFRELLARVRGDVLDAHDHADLPFEAVIETLGVALDPSHHPLYQVMFAYEAEPAPHAAAGASFTVVPLRPETMKVELSLALTDTNDGLLAEMDHRTDLFDAATVDAMLARLETVLERAGRDPDARASELTALDAAERLRAAAEWGAAEWGAAGWSAGGRDPGEATRPAEKPLPPPGAEPVHARAGEPVHRLVERQAAATPDAVAVEAAPDPWTYRELDAAAGRIADHLAGLGVGTETRVGVSLPRSPEWVAAILGVLKAGGTCVPLDPSLPAFRVRTTVMDAGIEVVLAGPRTEAQFAGARTRVVRCDLSDETIFGGPPAPRPDVAPGDAAFVLYTAGVTGEPNGVVLEHRNLANLLRWARRDLPAGTWEATPLLGSPGSGAALIETLAALTGGGRVVVADGGAARAASSATVICATPSLLARILAQGGLGPSVRTVLAHGEPLAPALARAALAAGNVEEVRSVYGTTEASLWSLTGRADDGEASIVPAGRPLDGTAAYILDDRLRPLPPGVTGALYIGGAGVARGHLDPRQAAERFVPDPFSEVPGARMVATGDLARRGPDGRVHIAGRAAHAVYRRGSRVEAGQIEAVLLEHPGVAAAYALVRPADDPPADEPAPGPGPSAADGALVAAAVVARPGTGLTPAELMPHLRGHLPGALMPERVVVTESLPLLPSGRPDPSWVFEALARAPVATGDEPPASAGERAVAGAWAAVLGRGVGVNENFFDAGGNSLLLVRLRDRLRDSLGKDVHLVDLFRHTTIRAMAGALGDPLGDADTPAPTGGTDRGRERREAVEALRRTRRPGPR